MVSHAWLKSAMQVSCIKSLRIIANDPMQRPVEDKTVGVKEPCMVNFNYSILIALVFVSIFMASEACCNSLSACSQLVAARGLLNITLKYVAT